MAFGDDAGARIASDRHGQPAAPRRAPRLLKRAGVSAKDLPWFSAVLGEGLLWCGLVWWISRPHSDHGVLSLLVVAWVVCALIIAHATVQHRLARSAVREAAYARALSSPVSPSIKALRAQTTLGAILGISVAFGVYHFVWRDAEPAASLSLVALLRIWAVVCAACVLHSVILAFPSRSKSAPDAVSPRVVKAPIDPRVAKDKERFALAASFVVISSTVLMPWVWQYAGGDWSSDTSEEFTFLSIAWLVLILPALVIALSAARRVRAHVNAERALARGRTKGPSKCDAREPS